MNDSATVDTQNIIAKFNQLTVITHAKNKGKGMALRNGFKKAVDMSFKYVITMDSDSQH